VKKALLVFCLLSIISIISFLFFINSEPVKFETASVAGKFSISVPEHLIRTDSIDPNALIQYQNVGDHLVLLVYEKKDSVKNVLEASFKNLTNELIAKIERGTLLKYFPKKINSRNAIVGNIRGNVNGTTVYYRIAVIEGAGSFYQIIVGVLEDNRSSFDEDINSIIDSFIILPS